jgi:hypothetical protein
VRGVDLADAADAVAAALAAAPQALHFAPGETEALFRAGRGRDYRVWRLGRSFIVATKAGDRVVFGDGTEEELLAILARMIAGRPSPAGEPGAVEVRCGPEPTPLLAACRRVYSSLLVRHSDNYRIGALLPFCRKACRVAHPRISAGDAILGLRNAENGQAVVLECRAGQLSARPAGDADACLSLAPADLNEFCFGLCPPETLWPDYPPDSPFRRVFPLPVHVNPLVGL